jgi:DNA repair exonuclease SbcCD nuclease subunit
MKIALLCDTHWGVRGNNLAFLDNANLFFDNVFFPYLDENIISTVIHLGDFVDQRKTLNVNTVKRLRIDFLDRLYLRGCTAHFIAGNHDCLDSETECLTKRGWLKYNEINQDDEILSLIENGKCKWDKIDGVLIKRYSGEMINIKSRRLDACMTPNHRCLVGEKKSYYQRKKDNLFADKPINYKLAKDILVTDKFISSADINNNEFDISDEMLKLIAWILTDGWISKKNNCIAIYQSKIKNVSIIQSLLDKLKLGYSLTKRDRNIDDICGIKLKNKPLTEHTFRISANSTKKIKYFINNKKELPQWLMELSIRQFEIFLYSIVDGDGTWTKNKTCATIYGKKEFLDELQKLCIIYGWRSKLSLNNRNDDILYVVKTNKSYFCKSGINKINYNGIVWCLQVPYTNFMVRRNGTAYFTGNCFFKNTNEVNSLQELIGDKYPDFYVHDMNAKEISIGGLSILLIPWICSENRERIFQKIKDTQAKIVFGHLELAGFLRSDVGIISDGDSTDIYKKFDMVCSGHYHHKSSKDNIHYLGATGEYTWGDYNDSRGFHIFDTETKELTYISNPYKMFKKLIYDDGFNEILDVEDCMVKIIVKKKTNVYLFENFIDSIEKQNPLSLQIVEDNSGLSMNNVNLINEAEASTLDMCLSYVDNIDLSSKAIKKDELKKMVINLYNEASTRE